MNSDLSEVIENEWYVVRYSGETPEIAYNSAIYHLTRAKDGPHISLADEQVDFLRQAAVNRYTEIVLRDLEHENCTKSIYRGVARSIINYQRFCKFCERQRLDVCVVRSQAAKALQVFIEIEVHQLKHFNRASIINCTYPELQGFAVDLGVKMGDWCTALEKHCLPPS